jgi:hypothetical protein
MGTCIITKELFLLNTIQVASSPTVTDSSSTDYIDPQGEIFATVGTGGINFHALSGKSSFVKYQQDDRFGALDLSIENNGYTLAGRY